MRKIIWTHILFLLLFFSAQAQVTQENDTLYINYSITPSEFGSIEEGLIIYRHNDELMGKSVRYNATSSSIPLIADSLINFYRNNKNDYTIMKAEWVLSKEQEKYICKLLDEIKTKPIDEDWISNAPEYYVILSKNENYVFIDRVGRWNKYNEIKEVLGIERISNFDNKGSRKKK